MLDNVRHGWRVPSEVTLRKFKVGATVGGEATGRTACTVALKGNLRPPCRREDGGDGELESGEHDRSGGRRFLIADRLLADRVLADRLVADRLVVVATRLVERDRATLRVDNPILAYSGFRGFDRLDLDASVVVLHQRSARPTPSRRPRSSPLAGERTGRPARLVRRARCCPLQALSSASGAEILRSSFFVLGCWLLVVRGSFNRAGTNEEQGTKNEELLRSKR